MNDSWPGPTGPSPRVKARQTGWRRPRNLVAIAAAALLTAQGAVTFWPALGENANAATAGVTGYAAENGGTTGGANGATVKATTGTELHQALCSRASKSTPLIIEVSGTFTVGNTGKVSGAGCSTAAGVIELKEISNVSIIGTGSGAIFDQVGIHIRGSKNIIIRNVTVRNVKKSGSPTSNGGDAIGMESDVSNVWVDHVSLEASGGEAEGFDSLIDMKAGVKYVTLSYSTLRNSGRGGLIGSSDTELSNSYITFHHNLYENIDSRAPLLRGGVAHIYNNYYVGLKKSGINSRAGAKARVENNYFKNSQDVLGTFYSDALGSWEASGNVLDNVTWSAPVAEMHLASPDLKSTASVPVPYKYTADPASCVPDVIARTAGAGKGLAVSDGSCKPTTPPAGDPAPQPTSTPTPTPKPTGDTGGGTAPAGTNLSPSAKVSGNGKASGSSYGAIVDGKPATFWSPKSSTGRVSLAWTSAQTISSAVITEASGATGAIQGWKLVNADTKAVLASGTAAGTAKFAATSLKKLNLEITKSSGTAKIAELETYASGSTGGGTTPQPDPGGYPEPTTNPAPDPAPAPKPGAWPSPSKTVQLSSTQNVSGSFDGGLARYQGWGGGQSEKQDPLFVLSDGATLKNVVIGNKAGDGVHCTGTCTLINVWWEDVGEDAATFKGTSASQTMTIDGGGARGAADKTFQHNGPGTFVIKNFQGSDLGKLYRACGNCTNSYKRDVVLSNVTLEKVRVAVVGINSNFGDTARFSNITIVGNQNVTVCQRYNGTQKGKEPTEAGEGPDGKSCIYKASDVTYK